MATPRIRHIALNVQNREECVEYYKKVFGMKESYRGPNGTVYLSDGFVNLALISATKEANGDPRAWGLHHIGFQVDSVEEVEKVANEKAQSIQIGAVAESYIHDPDGNRVDASEHGWPI